jgi:hypothetical protein
VILRFNRQNLGNKAEKTHTYKFVPCDTYKQTKSIMLTQKNFIFGQMFEDYAVPIEKKYPKE